MASLLILSLKILSQVPQYLSFPKLVSSNCLPCRKSIFLLSACSGQCTHGRYTQLFSLTWLINVSLTLGVMGESRIRLDLADQRQFHAQTNVDNSKEWTSLPMPELLTRVFRRKDDLCWIVSHVPPPKTQSVNGLNWIVWSTWISRHSWHRQTLTLLTNVNLTLNGRTRIDSDLID